MNLTEVNSLEMRECMAEPLSYVKMHRIACGQSVDIQSMTRIRQTFEERILLILSETNLEEMPANWSWKSVVKNLSWLMVIEAINHPGGELPDRP